MKKLLLVLALLILGSSGAFANTYPKCYQGYGVSDPLYNGTNGDALDTKGWCVDNYGVLIPKNTTVDSTNPNSQGGMAVPVIVVTNKPSAQTTFDVLLPQQTGNYITDTGGFAATVVTMDTLIGSGGHYVLPMAMPGEIYTISSGSRSTITVDVMTPQLATSFGISGVTQSDTIEWSPAGVGVAAGKNIQSTGGAGDSITIYSPAVGMWVITTMVGSGNVATQDSLWTVISTQ